jgi:hypothetical protein
MRLDGTIGAPRPHPGYPAPFAFSLGAGFCGWLVVLARFPGGDYRIEIGLDSGLAIRGLAIRLAIRLRKAQPRGCTA